MAKDSYVDNINALKILSKQIKSIDLLNPSSHTVTQLTEILDRCKNLPELELVDFNEQVNIDNIEADA